jgi:hypothetical protein
VLALGRQVLKQTAVRLVRRAYLEQLVGPLVEVCDHRTELVGVDHILVALVAQRTRVLEDPAGGVRNARLPRHRIGDQLSSPAKQVRMAGLVLGVGDPPIRRPSIALEHTRVILAEDFGGVLVPAARAIKYTVT